jgi:hypothetical protein
MLKIKAIWPIMTLISALWALAGCGERTSSAPPSGTVHQFKGAPPHGGTPVVIGENYRMELVLDAPAGRMEAYILDDDFENFVRIAMESFEMTARLPGREEVLVFKAVANHATGETVGDSSMFEAQADWLKTEKSFDAVLKQVTVRGTTYSNISFNFPKGNDTDENRN